MSATSDAVARVAEYVRQRDIAMSGGNVGDVITTVYADTEGEPAHLDVNDLRVLLHGYRPATKRSPLGHDEPPRVDVVHGDHAELIGPGGQLLALLSYERLLVLQERIEDAVRVMVFLPDSAPNPRKTR